MAVLKAEDIDFAFEDGRIRIRIGGKTHYLAPAEARKLSIGLGNLALDALAKPDPDSFPAIEDIRLRFSENGTVLLRLTTNVGDLAGTLPHRLLHALADASAAALEHGPTKGSA